MLQTSSLSYTIKEKVLLKKLSLHLKEGENITILGENGSGKSTLAKILCGIIASKEKVLLQGQYIEKIDSIKRAKLINYMPSKFSLYDPYITLNTYLNLSLYKSTPSEHSIKEILSHLQLSQYQNSYASHLSSGEQQLLLLASSMLQSADITIFDEPTSNLDPKKTKILFDILKSSDKFKQKILITHDLQFAYRLGYPILYLEKGEVCYFKDDFFTPKNLKHYFHDTIMIVDDFIVETL